MRLRGYIKKTDSVYITCCTNVDDVLIGEVSLYEKLDAEFNLDATKSFEDYEGKLKDPLIGVSYLILDEDPGDGSFEDIIGEWITKKLYSEYTSGCYSELTCGYGGYDYFIDGGHNIFKEILSYEGKYVLLDIDDQRDITINEILR